MKLQKKRPNKHKLTHQTVGHMPLMIFFFLLFLEFWHFNYRVVSGPSQKDVIKETCIDVNIIKFCLKLHLLPCNTFATPIAVAVQLPPHWMQSNTYLQCILLFPIP